MKIPGVGPDIEQAIQHFIALTFAHNYYPIALVIGIAGSIAWGLYKPQRVSTLLTLGLTLLFVHFEYIKHAMRPVLEQTQVTLTTMTPNHTFIWLVEKVITRGIPYLMLTSGAGLVMFVVIFQLRKLLKNHEESHRLIEESS